MTPEELAGTPGVDADIEFRSEVEFAFAHLWATEYPEIDLWYEWPLHPIVISPLAGKTKKARPKLIDFYHMESKTGIEINGGIHAKGGHSTGTGIQRDYAKQQLASAHGILLIPLSSEDSRSLHTLKMVYQAIAQRLGSGTP
jgi:hypothetical protein